jgi:hypothetical protein
MKLAEFDNAVPTCSLIEDVYHAATSDRRRDWGDPGRTAGDRSFFAWLNAPARRETGLRPVLSNLAVHVYDTRPDLRAAFPRLEGFGAVAYTLWFLEHAQREYGLDLAFVRPVEERFEAWGVAPSAGGPDGIPVITNFGAYLYSRRPDIQAQFPDLYGEHRVDFSVWFIHAARLLPGVRRAYILPVLVSWAAGAPRAYADGGSNGDDTVVSEPSRDAGPSAPREARRSHRAPPRGHPEAAPSC